MGRDFFSFVEAVVALFVVVAITALLISPKARTSQVIQASGSLIGNDLGVAESPVTGATYQIDLSYPNSGFGSIWDGGGLMHG